MVWYDNGPNANNCHDLTLTITLQNDNLQFSSIAPDQVVDLFDDDSFEARTAQECEPWGTCSLSGILIDDNQMEVIQTRYRLSSQAPYQLFKDCEYILTRQ